MTTYAEVRLRQTIKECGVVELTINGEDGVKTEKHTDVDEAIEAVYFYEDSDCEVYF